MKLEKIEAVCVIGEAQIIIISLFDPLAIFSVIWIQCNVLVSTYSYTNAVYVVNVAVQYPSISHFLP